MIPHTESSLSDRELLELVLRAPRTALHASSALTSVLASLVALQSAADRDRFLLAAGDAANMARSMGRPGKPLCARRVGRPTSPPSELLDLALLHARGRNARSIALGALAGRLELDAELVAHGLNDARLMVSLPAADSSDLDDWARVFQLAAALGAASEGVRAYALECYAHADLWELAHLPLDEHADRMIRWLASDFAARAPDSAAVVVASLVFSPEAFNVAAGCLLRELPRIDLAVFRPVLSALARFDRRGALASENPVRKFVQEMVRHAVEVTGDSIDAAAGLDVLFAPGRGNSGLPTSVDLALASTVATSIVAGRTGWRNPVLRPAMLEGALRGAPGCRRAALMLKAW